MPLCPGSCGQDQQGSYGHTTWSESTGTHQHVVSRYCHIRSCTTCACSALLTTSVSCLPAGPLALLIVNNADPANPVIHRRINVSTTAGEADVGTPNSVSVYNGYAAVSLDGVPYTADGIVRIYHLASGA